ncbi:DUF3300 domain-containing protein [Edaphobacter sp. HDX4]
MNALKKKLARILCSCLTIAILSGGPAFADEPGSPTPVTSAHPNPQELQQLVAPIALYPDSLVAQILAASTYPAQVVEADRWLQAHSDLKGTSWHKPSINSPGTRA